MASVFDGMAGVLNKVFGALVVIYPGGGAGVTVQAVLRNVQIEVADEDGNPVLTHHTILKVQQPDAVGLVPGNLVEQGGDGWRVQYAVPAESPAEDRFETFVLEKDQ